MSKANTNQRHMLAGIAIGAPSGTFLGWLLFDNIGLGAAVGTVIGAAIGSILDERGKKNR